MALLEGNKDLRSSASAVFFPIRYSSSVKLRWFGPMSMFSAMKFRIFAAPYVRKYVFEGRELSSSLNFHDSRKLGVCRM